MQREVCFVIAWKEKEIYNPHSLRNHLTPSFWRIWTAQQTIIVSHVTHLYGLTSWVLKSKRNNMTTEHENGKESVLYWILFSVFANLELLLLVHWRPISHISYTFNCLDLSLRGNSLPLDLSLIILKPSCPIP